MKHISLGRLKTDTRTLRVAATYLAIIMVLSLSFSVIFYRTSAQGLQILVRNTNGGGVSVTTGKASSRDIQPPATISASGVGIMNGQVPGPVLTESLPDINNQIQKQVVNIKSNLLVRLVLLNLGALVTGAVFSYYLARRTLQPMEAAMEVQSRFAADASHELRTPLTVMQTEIEVVLKKPKLSMTRAKAALQSNYQEVTRLKQLAEGLLSLTHDVSRDSNFSEIELDEIVSQAINRMIKPAQAKRMTITDTLPKLKIRGDAPSLVQVLCILLDNAVKYGEPGNTIYIDGKAEGKYVYLSVRDQGPGIRASDLPHIFERFYRAHPSNAKEHIRGYGLGLSIAQTIVRQHRGTLSVVSKLGEGSTFTIEIPA